MEQCSQNSGEFLYSEKSTEVVLYPELFPEEPPSVEAEIRRGLKELKQRQRKTKRETNISKRCLRKEVPKVAKIIFPGPTRFRGCRHNESVIIDRDLLNPNEHLRLLAMPREKPKLQYPRLVMKTIPAATNHIKTLAQPKAYYVRDIINIHGRRLEPKKLARMNERLNARDFLTIRESRQFARQQRRDDKQWVRHRQRQDRAFKKRIVRLEVAYLRDVMEKIYRETRNHFLGSNNPKLENELATASKVVLVRMCHLIGVKVPQRDGENILDQFYCELADKVASWIWQIMQTSGVTFERPEDIEKRLSAASSIFEDPSKRPEKIQEEEEDSEEEVIVDDDTRNIAMRIVESCIAAALLAINDVESHATYSRASEYSGGKSVSHTMMAAVSEETTRTERDKGSKVNFMPRKLSTGSVMSKLLEENVGDEGNRESLSTNNGNE